MLKDKVVVITGGAGLIGQEFVKAVVRQHGTAIIADINEDAGERAKEQLVRELCSDRVDFVPLDITSTASLEATISRVHERHGRIDALVNNAYPKNKNYGRHFFDVEYADFCENVSLNLGGYFLASQKFAEYFKRQGYGNIVNLASIYGVVPPKFEVYAGTAMTTPVEYAAIKSAVLHLTKYMAKCFKGMNIRVNALSPGGILDAQPARFLAAYRDRCLNKGMLAKSDLQGTLVYLLSDMSEYVNGQNIVVDDGFSL
jgi:NAD(P)-dependent dehydrogenase (short-subunit alcohol dehydrogenase family)